MAVLPILFWPDKRLTTVCSHVTEDASTLADAMLETMYEAPGRGLAAPQIGVLQRIFVMDCTWKEGEFSPQIFINPEILWLSEDTAVGPEGCLSLPGVVAQIKRAKSVKLRWHDLLDEIHEQTFSGFPAICIQHEFDHLNGILMLDHLDPTIRATAERSMS